MFARKKDWANSFIQEVVQHLSKMGYRFTAVSSPASFNLGLTFTNIFFLWEKIKAPEKSIF